MARSTIVLGLLTCIPFGLAIRDEVRGVAPIAPPEEVEEAQTDTIDLSREAEQEEQAARVRARQAEARDEFEQAFLASKIGFSLGGYTLGMSAAEGEQANADRIQRFESATRANVKLVWSPHLSAIKIDLAAHDDEVRLCKVLDEHLARVWPEPVVGSADGVAYNTWYAAADRARVSLHDTGDASDGCVMLVEHVAPLSELVDGKDAVVPVSLLGKSRTALYAAIGNEIDHQVDHDENHVYWQHDGVDVGWGPAALTAYLVKERVVAFRVQLDGPPALGEHLTQLFTRKYGAPADGGSGPVWTKGHVAIDETHPYAIVIGTLPFEEE